jgi:hypothetical protein
VTKATGYCLLDFLFVVNRFLRVFKKPVIPLFYGILLIKGIHRGEFNSKSDNALQICYNNLLFENQ